MKKTLLIILIFSGFFSCNKEEIITEIALADQISGKYNVSLFDWDGIKITLPDKNLAGEEISANLTIFRKSETKVDVILNLITKKNNGNSEQKTNKFENLDLKKSATEEIEIYNNNIKVGSIINGSLKLDLKDQQSKFIIQAKKDGL